MRSDPDRLRRPSAERLRSDRGVDLSQRPLRDVGRSRLSDQWYPGPAATVKVAATVAVSLQGAVAGARGISHNPPNHLLKIFIFFEVHLLPQPLPLFPDGVVGDLQQAGDFRGLESGADHAAELLL